MCIRDSGDTVRVSLSEEPAAEIPVARHLVDYIGKKQGQLMIPATACPSFDWLHPTRRETEAVGNIGGTQVPVVISNRINGESTICENKDAQPDYIYIGGKMPKQFVPGQSYIVDYNVYETLNCKPETTGAKLYPIFPAMAMPFIASIILGTIQLGATVDYSILMTTRYREERLALRSPKAAAQQALEHCSQSILTSGLTFFAATFGVAAISKVELLESICMLISRGALISMVVILLVLPAGLMLLDGLICRTTYHWLNAPNAAKE